MKRLLLIGLAALVGYTLWFFTLAIHSHRYKLTIELEKDATTYTGTSVVEVSARRLFVPIGDASGEIWVRGEATVIAISQESYIFGILANKTFGNDAAQYMALRAFNIPTQRNLAQFSAIRSVPGKANITAELVPTFVTFDDRRNPETARTLSLQSELVGAGHIRLKAAYVEMTREPITRQIDSLLPWIPEYVAAGKSGDFSLSGNRYVARVYHFRRD